MDVEELQREMDCVRRALHHDAGHIADRVRDLGDWRQVVRRHPWLVMGGAAALGYLLVPPKIAPRVVGDWRNGPSQPPPAPGRLLSPLVSMVVATALRNAMNIAGQKISSLLMERLTETPPSSPQSEPYRESGAAYASSAAQRPRG